MGLKIVACKRKREVEGDGASFEFSLARVVNETTELQQMVLRQVPHLCILVYSEES